MLGFFTSHLNWDSPTPSPGGEYVPSPFGSGGGGHNRMLERGWGSQFGRGDRHCGTLGIYVLCDMEQAYLKKTVQPFLPSVLAVHLCRHPSSTQRERPRGKKRKQSFWLCYLTGGGVGGRGVRKKGNCLLIFYPWHRQYIISYKY